MWLRIRKGFFLVGLVAISAVPLAAQSGYVADDWLGYGGGSVTAFGSLGDALAGTNALGSAAFPERDLSLYFIQNNAAFAGGGYPATEAVFLTNWFASSDGLDDGAGNPNNTNTGFLQLDDLDAGNVNSLNMGWTNPALTSFELSASGGPTVTGCTTIPPQDCGRLWNGQTSANGGSFISWNISLVLGFGAPATFNPLTGVYETDAAPTSASGQISGLFFDPTLNEWYTFDVSINNISTSAETDDPSDIPTAGGLLVTPEPAAMSLMALGFAGMAGAGIRRRKRGR